MLSLFFEIPDPHVDARGAHRFVLYQDGDKYPLPNVAFVTQEGTASVPVQEVAVAEVSLGSRENSPATQRLREEIQSAWAPAERSGLGHVTVRVLVAENRSVPADVVRVATAAVTDGAVSVKVTWRYLYTNENGVQAVGIETATLEFAPAGSKPPPHRPRLDPVAERLGVPAPVRSVGARPRYRYFAAVDFGTSSSTVTLYDARHRIVYRMDPGQAEMLRAAIARLLRTSGPGQLGAKWTKASAELAARVGRDHPQLAGDDVESLCRRLESTASSGGHVDTLLEITCATLDRLAAETTDKDLAQWLGSQILSCYDEAFDRPPLAALNLRPVLLDDKHGHEVPTELGIIQRSPVKIEFDTKEPDAVRNLKSKLGDAEPLAAGTEGVDGKDATTDDLIALVYQDLIDRTEQFARGKDKDAPDEALTELVVTFPTTTPSGTRQHLTRMLEYTTDLRQVSVDYDEGVAAALYFLMRDFGGTRPEFGAEALRARSKLISSQPPQWQQNMLVVDIGAGTTDIALLRLNLRDNSKPIAGVDPAVQGKYYIVSPEVVNSTGHPQLGGNYLTLRVFYWLKAAIIDAMLTGDGQADKRRELADQHVRKELGLGAQDPIPEFAHLVAEAGDVELPVPVQVAPVLSRLLPTHWGPDAEATAKDAFWHLWRCAESAKIALGRDRPEPDHEFVVSHEEIVNVLNAIDVKMSREREPLIPATGVRLDREDFQALARPVLAHAAQLAWWLVQRSLGTDERERLDRVMLSGKTSMMELTRRVITEELGRASTGTKVEWNPTAISVERTYAKQAASIGAAWAAEIAARVGGETGDRDELARGRSVLKINVDNVFNSLPCEFVLLRAQEQTSPLFEAGTPIVEIDKTGALAARKEWTDTAPWPVLVPAFEVHRPVQPNKTQVWGTYRFKHDAKEERGFTPDPRVWQASATGDSGAKIRAQVQIDQRLNPTLHLSRGRPHYLVTQADCVLYRDVHTEFPGDSWDPHEHLLRMLPAELWIVGASDKQHRDGEKKLFPLWLPAAGDLLSSYFPEYFHEHAGLDSEPFSGRIEFTLPAPSPDGAYRLLSRRPGTPDTDLAMIKVPAYGERTARYTATLDARGRFALHRGSPPYWLAGTLRDVEAHPGAVLHRTMEPGKTDRNPQWDPFTGNH